MVSRLVAVAAVLMSVVSLAACRRESPVDSPGGGHIISFAGEQRDYRLFVPSGADGPLPVVFMLHGGLGTAEHAEDAYGWDEAAQRHGFAMVYPAGLGRAWNVGGGCCGASGRQGVDDVGFIKAVLTDVGQLIEVDPSRVYATGMSNGAMLSHRLACDTDLFAAIAPVAGTLLGECPSPAPVSVLHIHGLADANVRFDGDPGTGIAEIDGPPVPDVLAMWRTVDGCDAPTTTVDGMVTTIAATCPQGRDVVLVTIDEAGHQWPGSATTAIQDALGADPPSTALDATETIADFFEAHPLA